MERRGFLKLLGLGAVTAAVASTVGIEAAEAAPAAPAPAATTDAFLDQLTEANKGDGEFAQYYYYRRPRYYVRRRYVRPRYYYRPRRCGWYRTYYGRVWRCV
ncbi:MAG: twin-arginine translocation signal domain-containing protein [Beijerinckiaceae bacterium]